MSTSSGSTLLNQASSGVSGGGGHAPAREIFPETGQVRRLVLPRGAEARDSRVRRRRRLGPRHDQVSRLRAVAGMRHRVAGRHRVLLSGSAILPQQTNQLKARHVPERETLMRRIVSRASARPHERPAAWSSWTKHLRRAQPHRRLPRSSSRLPRRFASRRRPGAASAPSPSPCPPARHSRRPRSRAARTSRPRSPRS